MRRICTLVCAYYDCINTEARGLVYLKTALSAQIRLFSVISKRAYNAFTLVYLTAPPITKGRNPYLWIARWNSSDDIGQSYHTLNIFVRAECHILVESHLPGILTRIFRIIGFSFLRSEYIVAVLPKCAEPSVWNSYCCAYRSRIMTQYPVLRAIEGGRKSRLPFVYAKRSCDLMSVWTDIKLLYHQQPIATLHFPQIALDLAAALITQCWRNESFCLPTITMIGILFQPFRAIVFLKNEY